MNLRRTFQPYVGQTILLAGVSIFVCYEAVRTSDWKFALSPLVIWVAFGLYVLIALKYRVRWDDTGVYMLASGAPQRFIPFDEITDIRYELAGPSEFGAQSRPFRRIVIHGHKRDPKALVDVSLRHFRLNDINAMMTAIRQHRPDLKVPTVSMNGRVEFG